MQNNKKIWSKIFSEPETIPVIKNNKETIKKQYIFWRNSIFITSYIIYMIAYFCRKSFNMVAPLWSGLNSWDMGIILGVGSVVYGIGKLINGCFADKGNVRFALPINGIMAGLCTALMALTPIISEKFPKSNSSMLIYMCISWGVSQWFQSALFPYCGKSLIRWFPNKTRSFWWSSWSTSHEFGTFIWSNIALVIGFWAESTFGFGGKEAVFIVPFILSLIIGIIGLFSLRDRPVSMGLPDVEKICSTNFEKLSESDKKEIDEDSKLTYVQMFKKYIIKSKVMWNLAFIYLCVYIFRQGPVDWIFKILTQNKSASFKNPNYLDAFMGSTICLIGAFGTLFAPIISEKMFKGRRAPANFWCLIIGGFSVIGIWLGTSKFSPVCNNEFLKNMFSFLSLGIAGFTVCVPQVLVGGISAAENSSKRVAAAATGFASLFGYFGAAIGSIVNGYLNQVSMEKYKDARLVLIYWGFAAFLGALLCIPLWNVRANKEYTH